MRKKLTLTAMYTYCAQFILGLVLAVGLIFSFKNISADLSGGALVFAFVFMLILALLYLALSVFPFLFKYRFYKNNKFGFNYATLPFDALQLVISIMIFVFSIKSADPLGIIVTLALLLSTVGAVASNILTIVMHKHLFG